MAFSSPTTLAVHAIATNRSKHCLPAVEFGANRSPGSTFAVSTTLAVYSCGYLPPSFRRQCPWGYPEEFTLAMITLPMASLHHEPFPPPWPFDQNGARSSPGFCSNLNWSQSFLSACAVRPTMSMNKRATAEPIGPETTSQSQEDREQLRTDKYPPARQPRGSVLF